MDPHQVQADTAAGTKRNNHKGATLQSKMLNKLVSKDMEHTFSVPITTDAVTKIKNSRFDPLNRTQKQRLTHDQSFQGLVSSISSNKQVVADYLEPLIYGNVFLCICHMIHSKHLQHPFIHILMFKINLDSVFHRMH